MRFRQHIYIIRHIRQEFVYRYAAYSGILIVHGDIVYVVQLAEYAQLREFCYACNEYKAQL